MVQNGSWEWLIEGFRIDLETQVKPKTVKDYCDHVSYFARWTQRDNKRDPRSITKRDIQEFLHFVASTPAILVTGNGAKRRVQRDENSRWHHYFPLKRFFTWGVSEGYLKQNPIDSIVLKPPKAMPIEPYRPEHIYTFVRVLDHDWQVATTTQQKMLELLEAGLCYFCSWTASFAWRSVLSSRLVTSTLIDKEYLCGRVRRVNLASLDLARKLRRRYGGI